MRARLFGVLCVGAFATGQAFAQEPLKPGARVRVIAEDGSRRNANVLSDARDSTVIRFDAAGVGEIPGAAMPVAHSRLEALVAVRRHKATGALLGGVAGFATGWMAAEPLDRVCFTTPAGYYNCDEGDAASAVFGVAGLLAGAGIGALMGRAFKSEVWRPVSKPGAAMHSPQPTAGTRRRQHVSFQLRTDLLPFAATDSRPRAIILDLRLR